jgi:hypothetical protein
MANHAPSTTKKFLAAAGFALGLGILGLFASSGTAAADGLDAAPMGAWPADPSWPAPRIGGLGGGLVLAGVLVASVLLAVRSKRDAKSDRRDGSGRREMAIQPEIECVRPNRRLRAAPGPASVSSRDCCE